MLGHNFKGDSKRELTQLGLTVGESGETQSR